MGWWGRDEGICTNLDASTALNKAADRPIEEPPLNKDVTALLQVPVVPRDFGRLMSGYRLTSTALLRDHHCIGLTLDYYSCEMHDEEKTAQALAHNIE